DQIVAVAHGAHRADDRRLLADREVQEAADLRLCVHLARTLLEAADECHRLEPLDRYIGIRQLLVRHRPGSGPGWCSHHVCPCPRERNPIAPYRWVRSGVALTVACVAPAVNASARTACVVAQPIPRRRSSSAV